MFVSLYGFGNQTYDAVELFYVEQLYNTQILNYFQYQNINSSNYKNSSENESRSIFQLGFIVSLYLAYYRSGVAKM